MHIDNPAGMEPVDSFFDGFFRLDHESGEETADYADVTDRFWGAHACLAFANFLSLKALLRRAMDISARAPKCAREARALPRQLIRSVANS